MSATDKDLVDVVSKLKHATLFPVRARIYQNLSRNASVLDSNEGLTDELLDNYLPRDLSILSNQVSPSLSEYEAMLKLTYNCLKMAKNTVGEKFSKLLPTMTSCKADSPSVILPMVQCVIVFLLSQKTISSTTKRQISDFMLKVENCVFPDSVPPADVFSDYLALFQLLLSDNENVQIAVVGIIRSMRKFLEHCSREQKTELLKSVDNESFRNNVRNLSRSPTLHHLVSDVLLILIPCCGDVLHSATLVNVILAWATYLAKSLIHDAALSFYVIWTALIDNFSENKAVITSNRHRKLILSGFGPSLTNAKLRTPELMAAKIRAWWYFISKTTRADPESLVNADAFMTFAAPLITMLSGDTIGFSALPTLSATSNPSAFSQSDFGKMIITNTGPVRNELISLSCEVLTMLLMTSIGTNSFEKVDNWLKSKHQAVVTMAPCVEAIGKSTTCGLQIDNIASNICVALSAMLEELNKLRPVPAATEEAVAPVDVSQHLGGAFSHVFSSLLFWLASSVDCSQNAGAPHWRDLASILDNGCTLPVEHTVLVGLHAAFVIEYPGFFSTSSAEHKDEEKAFNTLVRFVDLVSKASTGVSHSKNSANNLPGLSDPSPSTRCIEMALMKMLAQFRKYASALTFQQSNWKLLESIANIVAQQNPTPPAFVVNCWLNNWLRLAELAEGWLRETSNAFELPTLVTFLAMPFKLLRLCPLANGQSCCRIIPKTAEHHGAKIVACQCSSCDRLLSKDTLVLLSKKWQHLFEMFCNAPATDTPRLNLHSGSTSKLCTKLLKYLKPTQTTSFALPLPFLAFAALCFDSMREKAFAAITNSNAPRRTSRASVIPQHTESANIFVRCVAAACKETAESLSSVVTFANHVHQQFKRSCVMTSAPLGYLICSTVRTYATCFEALGNNINSSGINEFSAAASTFIPVTTALLASAAKAVESADADMCFLGDPKEFSPFAVSEAIVQSAKQILSTLNKFTDVKNALLSANETKPSSPESHLTNGFSELILQLTSCKRHDFKQLARDISRDLCSVNGTDKHSFGSEMITAAALMPDSQIKNEVPAASTRTRGKRAASLAPRSTDSVDEPALNSLLHASPQKSKAVLDPKESSPLVTAPQTRKAPNTISTSTGSRSRASIGVVNASTTKRPSSVLGKRPATIDMEQSSDFVVVEASQDIFESAKKRRMKATDHQLEVMKERKTRGSTIPPLFNTLDAESQQSSSALMSLPDSSKDVVESSLQSTLETSGSSSQSSNGRKKRIVGSRKLCPAISKADWPAPKVENKVPVEDKKENEVIVEETQNDENISNATASNFNDKTVSCSKTTPLADTNGAMATPTETKQEDTSQNCVPDSATPDLFSTDSTESSNTVLLEMDMTIPSAAPSDAEDEVDTAAMMMVADSIEAAAIETNPVVVEEDSPQSPDVIESSLTEQSCEQVLDSVADRPEVINDSQPELVVESVSEVVSIVPSSQSPPSQVSSSTLEPMEITLPSANSVDTAVACNSPLQQSAAAIAIMRAARGTPSSPGILKRPQSTNVSNTGGIVDTPSPARKSRHVSFSAKTYVKEISPINANSHGHESVFMSWRSRRGDRNAADHQQPSTPIIPPPIATSTQAVKENPSAPSSDPKAAEQTMPKSDIAIAQQVVSSSSRIIPIEVASSPTVGNISEIIHPSLINCNRSIGEILPQIASGVQFQHGLLAMLKARGIHTIGDLAKLTLPEVRRLPIRSPQAEVAKAALVEFEKKIGCQREGISRMAMMLGSRNSLNVEAAVVSSSTTNDLVKTVSAQISEPPVKQMENTILQSTIVKTSADTKVENCEITSVSPGYRSMKVGMDCVEVDSSYQLSPMKLNREKRVEIGTQTDSYSLSLLAIIDQLNNITPQAHASSDYLLEHQELITAYSRWCQKAIVPKL